MVLVRRRRVGYQQNSLKNLNKINYLIIAQPYREQPHTAAMPAPAAGRPGSHQARPGYQIPEGRPLTSAAAKQKIAPHRSLDSDVSHFTILDIDSNLLTIFYL